MLGGKISQKELVLEYLNEHDLIVPSRMSGKIYQGVMFGHSIDKRCRELRKEGLLISKPWVKNPKFEAFLKPKEQLSMF